MKSSFSFLVMSYNHEKYVIEHLESIKFLVENFGNDIDIDLILNDDASQDRTVYLIEEWTKCNSGLFHNIIKLYNQKNIGTCKSLLNMLTYDISDRCKISAADDVYSFENIFKYTECNDNVAIVSGYPLYLVDGELSRRKKSDLLMAATQEVYKKKDLIKRFKHPGIHNAPSILYSSICLKDSSTLEYLSRFKVVEDWPIQISIARKFPLYKFNLVNKVLVYYRKTSGSTFYIMNTKFNDDINQIYSDLIESEKNLFDLIRLKIRRFCNINRNMVFINLLNLDYFIFILHAFFASFNVIVRYRSLRVNDVEHLKHYKLIQFRTKLFLENQISFE